MMIQMWVIVIYYLGNHGGSEGTSSIAYEVLIINCEIDFINFSSSTV